MGLLDSITSKISSFISTSRKKPSEPTAQTKGEAGIKPDSVFDRFVPKPREIDPETHKEVGRLTVNSIGYLGTSIAVLTVATKAFGAAYLTLGFLGTIGGIALAGYGTYLLCKAVAKGFSNKSNEATGASNLNLKNNDTNNRPTTKTIA